MTVFWLVALLFVAGALMIVLPALWTPPATGVDAAATHLAAQRAALREVDADLAAGLIDAERHAQARREIEQRVVEEMPQTAAGDARPARRAALALVLGLPLASVLVYLQFGRPDAAVPTLAPGPAQLAATPHAATGAPLEARVAALAERLQADPRDADGWITLGRSYTALGRYADGAAALRKAVALLPPDAGLLADLADLVAMSQRRRLAGEPARLVQQALDVDPRHVKALALAGSVAFEARDYAGARGYWERIVAILPADSPVARSVRGSLAEAAALEQGEVPSASPAAISVAAAATPADGGGTTVTATPSLKGRVQLDPALAARVQPGDTLFIFARAAEGPRMPLAIVRRPADGGPWDFSLDDSLAMAPSLRLSGHASVVVGARISRSGNATPQPGDLVGQSGPVSSSAQGVQVRIDRVQP